MVAAQLEQVPSDKAVFQESYFNYITTQAADLLDHFTGVAVKPNAITDALTNNQKRRRQKEIDEFKSKENKSWQTLFTIVSKTPLNYIIQRFIKSENRVKEAWQEILTYYTDVNPAQQKLLYQSKINSLTIKNTGSLKLDCESTITTLDNLFHQLSQLPAPYTTTYTEAEMILALRKILVNTSRFIQIVEKVKAPATYTIYKDLIKEEILDKELNDNLRGGTSTVDNKAIQALNETSTASALLIRIANGETVDYTTILENEGPDPLKALHSLVRNVKDDISQTSRNHYYNSNKHYNKSNKYNNYDRNRAKHEKVLNKYTSNHNYNTDTRSYDSTDRNTRDKRDDRNYDHDRKFGSDQNYDRRQNKNYNRYDNNRYDKYDRNDKYDKYKPREHRRDDDYAYDSDDSNNQHRRDDRHYSTHRDTNSTSNYTQPHTPTAPSQFQTPSAPPLQAAYTYATPTPVLTPPMPPMPLTPQYMIQANLASAQPNMPPMPYQVPPQFRRY
jgi:hypothetical protein